MYGGQAGRHILAPAARCACRSSRPCTPCSANLNADQRRVMRELAELSSRLIVMSQRGREFLLDVYGVPDAKIDVIAHGIPDMPFVDPNAVQGAVWRRRASTSSSRSDCSLPNKGIEYALRRCRRRFGSFRIWYTSCGRYAPESCPRAWRNVSARLERWQAISESAKTSSFTTASSNGTS